MLSNWLVSLTLSEHLVWHSYSTHPPHSLSECVCAHVNRFVCVETKGQCPVSSSLALCFTLEIGSFSLTSLLAALHLTVEVAGAHPSPHWALLSVLGIQAQVWCFHSKRFTCGIASLFSPSPSVGCCFGDFTVLQLVLPEFTKQSRLISDSLTNPPAVFPNCSVPMNVCHNAGRGFLKITFPFCSSQVVCGSFGILGTPLYSSHSHWVILTPGVAVFCQSASLQSTE